MNEEETIEDCLAAVTEAFPSSTEILVVDGGSDRTGEIVTNAARLNSAIRCIENKNDRGKGHAVRVGMSHARGRYQAEFDADLQFFPNDLKRLFEVLRDGNADVVLGTRFRKASGRDEEAGLVRTFGNRLVSAYFSLLFGQRLTDVLAGIKAWTKEAADEIDLSTDGFSYEIEIPAMAIRKGLRVREIPVGTQARRAGTSKVHVFGEGLRFLRDTTRFRFRSLSVKPYRSLPNEN